MTTDRVKTPPRPSTRLARSPLAVLSSAVAAFLVAFTLLSARVLNGTDPGLRGGAQAQVVSRTGHTILRTTASGHVIREQVAAAPGRTAPAGLVTSSSGASGGGEADG